MLSISKCLRDRYKVRCPNPSSSLYLVSAKVMKEMEAVGFLLLETVRDGGTGAWKSGSREPGNKHGESYVGLSQMDLHRKTPRKLGD